MIKRIIIKNIFATGTQEKETNEHSFKIVER